MTDKPARPRAGLGLTAHVPADRYQQTKPARNRPRVSPPKVKTTKPRPHQVGRTKR